jgi:hypothetical protein
VPKVTTRSLYPECIANWKLPIDAFYRESRSRNVGKVSDELSIENPLVDLNFLLFVNITGNGKNHHAHTRQIIIAD